MLPRPRTASPGADRQRGREKRGGGHTHLRREAAQGSRADPFLSDGRSRSEGAVEVRDEAPAWGGRLRRRRRR